MHYNNWETTKGELMKKIYQKKNIVVKGIIILVITFLLIAPVQVISSQQMQSKIKQLSLIMETKAWTALYYIDADSKSINADILESKFINEVSSSEQLNVLILQDMQNDPAFLYYIDEQHNKILLKDLGEVNMGEPQTLSDFISYGKEHYPAERYQLCIWGHANAWYGVCPDETSGGDMLTSDEFQQALSSTEGVDLLCFIGCCQMGSLEVVYELKDLCEVYIGSEDVGYGPHWYGMIDEMCELLNNNIQMSTVEYGEQIVQLIGNNPNEYADVLTISAMRTDRIQDLVDNIETLSIHLYENDDELYENLKSARANTKDYEFIKKSYLLDIYDFADNYLKIETNQTIYRILNNIKTNLSETVIAECHGEMQSSSHGLSIFYSSSNWGGLPGSISLYINYALDFTRDTHWDELLNNHKEKSKSVLINNLFNQFLKINPYFFPLLHQILELK